MTAHKMIVYRYMFHKRVKDMIYTEICGSQIVTEESGEGGGKENMKFREKICKPKYLGGASGKQPVFLRRPEDGTTAKVDDEGDGGTVILIAHLIRIRECNEG